MKIVWNDELKFSLKENFKWSTVSDKFEQNRPKKLQKGTRPRVSNTQRKLKFIVQTSGPALLPQRYLVCNHFYPLWLTLIPSDLHNHATNQNKFYMKNMWIDVKIPFPQTVRSFIDVLKVNFVSMCICFLIEFYQISRTRATIWNFHWGVASSQRLTQLSCSKIFILTFVNE
jgi:hypothetical protein